ncbi:hypothetical protein [Deinococcus sp. Marseille-Q6407]|uniref:hypothetical protein n=1 Tax=Deinococcus sp. Marseille-Q6407 TaxID=2969223 RepID=UPI0021BF48FE|nr:hypothetical protein [Deinococcus sp. Marseille-Q6407]
MSLLFRHAAPARLPVLASLLIAGLSSCQMLQPAATDPGGTALLAPDTQLQEAAATTITHRADGTVLVNGHSFFPFGFYHVSWAWQGTPQRRAQDIQRLAQSGFNLIVTEPVDDQDSASFAGVLDQAQQAGIFVIPYGLSPETQQSIGHHPALLGFKVADDVTTPLAAQQAAGRSEQLRALNPEKLTYLSLAVGQEKPDPALFRTADLIGNQSYPIGNDDISVTYRTMHSAVESALAQGRVPIANLQSSFWGTAKPTPDEVRNMTYQALLAGAKGVVYYAYRATESDLDGEPFLWRGFQQLSQEVAQLSPLLLDGELLPLSHEADITQAPLTAYLRGRDASSQEQGYLIAVNTNRRQTQTVQLQLPETPTRWDTVGSVITATLEHSGEAVTGTLAPLQVTVVRMR